MKNISVLIYRSEGLWISLKTSLHHDPTAAVRCVAWSPPVPVIINTSSSLEYWASAFWGALLLLSAGWHCWGLPPRAKRKLLQEFIFCQGCCKQSPTLPLCWGGGEECQGFIPQLRSLSSQQNVLQSCPQIGFLSDFRIKHWTFSPQC